ncbi:hypothetical protein AB6A40_007510 [Gnathostoma spinigerum]|uniref:Uncharacterized protein n=1 Tax=Gnathostoma spinigerum TaxID=75299 RepID=A0ABD6ETM2_9BILA
MIIECVSHEMSWKMKATLTQFMYPRPVAKEMTVMASHASEIEVHEFVATQKPASSVSKAYILISNKRCDVMRICFGSRHTLINQLPLKSKTDIRELQYAVSELLKLGRWNVEDVCVGMNIIEWEYPRHWEWIPNNDKGKIRYSTFIKPSESTRNGSAIIPKVYNYKETRISNQEMLTIFKPTKPGERKGIEIQHGPIGKAVTTFYEDIDILPPEGDPFYIIFAQNASKCGARLMLPLEFNSLKGPLTRKIATAFTPARILRLRTGINVWATALGYIAGNIFGVVLTSIILCRMSKAFYKKWNDEMKKIYGRFAMTDPNVSVMGGVSQMGGGTGLSTMGGTSAMGGLSQLGTTPSTMG